MLSPRGINGLATAVNFLIFYLTAVNILSTATSFPIGVNLNPLGGNQYTTTYSSVTWDPVSTNVFIDIFKHCGLFYLRSVSVSDLKYFIL